MVYQLRTTRARNAFRESATWHIRATVEASSWKEAYQLFKASHPRIMSKFGNGAVAIVKAN